MAWSTPSRRLFHRAAKDSFIRLKRRQVLPSLPEHSFLPADRGCRNCFPNCLQSASIPRGRRFSSSVYRPVITVLALVTCRHGCTTAILSAHTCFLTLITGA